MKRIGIFIVLLMCTLGLKAASENSDSLWVSYMKEYAHYGQRQLADLLAQNSVNRREGKASDNNYVLDFATLPSFNDYTSVLGKGDYTGSDKLDAASIQTLNKYLQGLNDGSKPDIYVAINLRLGLVFTTKEISGSYADVAYGNTGLKIQWQNREQVIDNHAAIRTHFINEMNKNQDNAPYVLFTWGKYFQVSNGAKTDDKGRLKVKATAYYNFWYNSSIYNSQSGLILDYVLSKSGFHQMSNTSVADLINKYKACTQSLSYALANIDKVRSELNDMYAKDLKQRGKAFYDAHKGNLSVTPDVLFRIGKLIDKVDEQFAKAFSEEVTYKPKDRMAQYLQQQGLKLEDYIRFENALKNYYDQHLMIEDALAKSTEDEKTYELGLTLNPVDLKTLSADTRWKLLQAIYNLRDKKVTETRTYYSMPITPMGGGGIPSTVTVEVPYLTDWGDHAGKLVMALLQKAPSSQYKPLALKLVESPALVLDDYNRIKEDIGKENLYDYVDVLYSICYKDHELSKSFLNFSSYQESMQLVWGNMSKVISSTSGDGYYQGTGTSWDISYTVVNNQLQFKTTNYFVKFGGAAQVGGFSQRTPMYDINVKGINPLKDVLYVYIDEPISLVPQYQPGKAYPLPAIALIWAIDNQLIEHRENLVKAGKFLLDYATFFIGLGELKAGYKGFRLLWAYTEIAVAGSDMVLNYSGIRGKLEKSEAGQDFLGAWDKFSAVVGVASVSNATFELGTNAFRAWKRNRAAIKQALTDAEFARLERGVNSTGRKLTDEGCDFSEFLEDVPYATLINSFKNTAKGKLPPKLVEAIKKLGKTEDEIMEYFAQYQYESEFFNIIDDYISDPLKNVNNLSSEDVYTIWGYTTSLYYGELNSLLRQGKDAHKTAEAAAMLSNALKKLNTAYSGPVYRAIQIAPADLGAFLSKYQDNMDVVWKEFTSAGTSTGGSFMVKSKKNVIFEIESTFSGKDISDFADGIRFRNMQPKEILFDQGLKLKVVGTPTARADGKIVIKLKEIL